MLTENHHTYPPKMVLFGQSQKRLLNSILHAGSFSSSAVLSDKSDPNSDILHPEIPGSDISPSQTAHATGSHKPGGWDPPEIPGSVHDHPHPSKEHPSKRRSSPSLPENDGGQSKLQRDRGMYVMAKPPQTEAPIPARGPPEAPLQESHESDSQVTNPCFCHSCVWNV